MHRITSLTPAQESLLDGIRSKWLDVGLASGSTDRSRVEGGIWAVYEAAGLAPPEVILWFESPPAARAAAG